MKNRIIVTAFVFIISLLTVHGQDYTNGQDKFKHFIGLGAGFTTGYGASYRYEGEKNGIGINFYPYYNKNGNSNVSAGITLLHKLKEGNDHRLFLYYSNSILYQKNYYSGNTTYYPYSVTPPSSTQSSSYNTGIGLDIQFFNSISPFVFDIMGGFGAYDSFQRITFTGELALYYKL